MVTSSEVGQRRLKVSSRDELAELVEDGLAYSFTGSYSASDGEVISINLNLASEAFIKRVTTNPGFKIEIYSDYSTGSPDGILQAHNLNRVSGDVSPASAQIYCNSTPTGDRLEVGYSEIDPYILTDSENDTAIAITNNSGDTEDVDFVIIFEEVGARAPLFGLTPSTLLTPTTEMSQYG